MVYDCFPFFNELDVLELRLNELSDVVDRFVLVEAPWTHRGVPKPLYYQENEGRFAAFRDRIIHVVVQEDETVRHAVGSGCPKWILENVQRNRIVEGLKDAKPDDVVLISDLDEIPNPKDVPRTLPFGEVRCFEHYHAYYRLNLINCTRPTWFGTRALTYATLLSPDGYRLERRHPTLDPSVNPIPSATRIRTVRDGVRVRRSGWHFSYLGDAAHIALKKRSIVDGGDVTGDDVKLSFLERCIQSGRDVNCKMDRYLPWPKDDARLPRYVLAHQERFDGLLVDPRDFRFVPVRRLFYRFYGCAYELAKRWAPASLVQALYEFKIRLVRKRVAK